MRDHLRRGFADVRQLLLTEARGRRDVVRRNLRGDLTRGFDLLAEERITSFFREAIAEPVRILGEECGEVRTRPGRAAWTLIVDPVDGSENFSRGMEMVSVAFALLPGEEEPHPDAVEHALVGNLITGTCCEATRGEGAWRDDAPIQPSPVAELSQAVVGVDLHGVGPAAARPLARLAGAVKDVRRFGTAAGELAAVAYGGLDGYVDARDRLSPENYMAATLIVREAGGIVTGRRGEPLAPIRSMAQGQSLVAAANAALHTALLEFLAEETA
jgi:myo-inositol-1(or 4)-monophosphatase